MALTREDIFRELELLPVWRARQPAPITPAPIEETTQVVEEPTVVEKVAEIPHINEVAEPIKQKTEMPWVLVFQVADDQAEAGRVLVQNIVRAMRLPQNEYVVLSQSDEVFNYQAKQVILFGQTISDLVLKEEKTSIESLRGQPVIKKDLEATQFWVTESVDAMLAEPSLKRRAWQELQTMLVAAE